MADALRKAATGVTRGAGGKAGRAATETVEKQAGDVAGKTAGAGQDVAGKAAETGKGVDGKAAETGKDVAGKAAEAGKGVACNLPMERPVQTTQGLLRAAGCPVQHRAGHETEGVTSMLT